ncbi:MAG: hypothetical protein ACKVS8_09190 [Phycisphaerales bacterium]
MFAADRDLLVLEPNLFRDVSWLGQRLFTGLCTISGTTLTASGVDFAALGVDAGHVVLVDGASLEVVARVNATTLTVSRPRAGLDDAAIAPLAGIARPLSITTFAPQLGIVHRQVLAMLGLLEAASEVEPEVLTESAVMNPRDLRLLEALGTLHLVFAALGGAGAVAGSPESGRAEMYRQRFAAERGRVSARIDTDGDGLADATRRPSVMMLVRD